MANSLCREIILTFRSPKRILRGLIGDYRQWLRKPYQGPAVALASFPRSGNTWVRHLVEKATGLETGSIQYDRVMARPHFDGIVTKTHLLDSDQFEKAVHLVRMPFDAIESTYDYVNVVIAEKKAEVWDEFVGKKIEEWKKHYQHWSAFEGPRILVRYEDLLADTTSELRKILEFIEQPVSDGALTAAVNACSISSLRKTDRKYGEKFFRRGEIGASLVAFTEAQRIFVMKEVQSEIEELGYTSLLNESLTTASQIRR